MKPTLFITFFLLIINALPAQGTKADYEKAYNHGRTFNHSKLKRHRVKINWDKNERWLWYKVDISPGKPEYCVVDLQSGRKIPISADKLIKGLKEYSQKDFPRNLDLKSLIFDDNYKKFTFHCRGKKYSCSMETYKVSEFKEIPTPKGPAAKPQTKSPKPKVPGGRSPNGKWQGFVKNHNLFLRDLKSKQEFQLTKDGSEQDSYNRVYFSYDSKKLVCIKTKKVQTRKVYIVESSPKDQLQPKLHTLNYAKPGDKLAYSRPFLFDAETQKEIKLDESLYENPWSNQKWRWSHDSKSFTFLHNRRGHQILRVISIDAQTGKSRAVIDELSKTFIHYSGKTYLKQLDESKEIIWMSERSGWNHLYLFDENGKLKNPITKGSWPVKKVLKLDPVKRQIWFTATGIYPDQDPYHLHFCRINFDGSGLTMLTEADGNHHIQYSPSENYLTDTYQRVDLPPVVEVRDARSGKLISLLEKTDHSELLKAGWKAPIRFNAKGRDGKSDIWGIIILPTNFDKNKKYPVVEQIYAGPHGSHVPKNFSTSTRTMRLAELGFITVHIDGMGTSDRSKAFHDVCWQNLSDSGFPDRILWMKAAAKKIPQMDISRVGIYGGSAGGQNALSALLNFGDFYKAAAADCGCHDNGMDKIWWNEQWMGAIGSHYKEQSNVTHAHKLKGKLLLTVGELDKNVDPASTMQVVDALIKADKDFELVVIPGGGHGSGWSRYGTRRLYDFFIRHLHGIEPRIK
jgi:dipeptidyl aminopeptidase/acylaminoacyl peptidase